MRHNESGLFAALEKVLRDLGEPLDCQRLFDMPEIREHAASANRVSDYLGGLWRKGLVVRLPAAPESNSKARWAYQWKQDGRVTAPGSPERGIDYAPRILADRPTILITEEGKTITIELPSLFIIIRPKT
jgi:hypothetical protein